MAILMQAASIFALINYINDNAVSCSSQIRILLGATSSSSEEIVLTGELKNLLDRAFLSES